MGFHVLAVTKSCDQLDGVCPTTWYLSAKGHASTRTVVLSLPVCTSNCTMLCQPACSCFCIWLYYSNACQPCPAIPLLDMGALVTTRRHGDFSWQHCSSETTCVGRGEGKRKERKLRCQLIADEHSVLLAQDAPQKALPLLSAYKFLQAISLPLQISSPSL